MVPGHSMTQRLGPCQNINFGVDLNYRFHSLIVWQFNLPIFFMNKVQSLQLNLYSNKSDKLRMLHEFSYFTISSILFHHGWLVKFVWFWLQQDVQLMILSSVLFNLDCCTFTEGELHLIPIKHVLCLKKLLFLEKW